MVLVCSLLLSACASQPPDLAAQRYWPAPPAEPRVVYELSLRHSQSLSVDASLAGRFKSLAGGAAVAEPVFDKPYDVAARKGLVVVSDSQTGRLVFFDVPRRRVFAAGWRNEGRLLQPLGLAMDARQQVYVADGGRGQVVVFDRLGHFVRSIGEPRHFSRLADVAVSADGNFIYALDRGRLEDRRHRIAVFDGEGRLLRYLGERGHGPGSFNHPASVAVDGEGRLLVMDAGNFRVQRFTAEGEFEAMWGEAGRYPGQFARPRGLAVDDVGRVYVTDSAFQNVQLFNAKGQLLLAVGRGGSGGMGQFMLPGGVATDETGRFYVVDQILRKVEVFRLLNPQERAALKP